MNERLKGMAENTKAFFTKLNKKIIIICLVIIVIAAIVIAVVLNSRPYSVLFTGLSSDEISSVISYLNNNGETDYKIEGNDTVLVPSTREEDLKAAMLLEGYPTTGFAYETYLSVAGTMSTDSERNRAFLMDLQDRMAGVIKRMDGVKDAVVEITLAEDQTYILDRASTTQASASVLVTMQGNAELSNRLSTAIRNLVSHAVQGLDISNVYISDTLGNSYSSDGDYTESGDASLLKLHLEQQVNNTVRTQIMSILTPIYGENNVRVGVNSTVDVRRSVGESIYFTEPDWAADGSTNGRGIIGSQIYDREIIRDADDYVGGVVGSETNSDINTYVEDNINVTGDEAYLRDQGEIDYYVDTEKEQVERVAATVTDVMVSVSINSEAAGNVNSDNLLSHVARVAGIESQVQGEKISILFAPFFKEPSGNIIFPDDDGLIFSLQPWIVYAAAAGIILLLIIIIIISSARRKKRKRKAKELSAMLGEQLDDVMVVREMPETGADIMTMRTEKSMELRRDIRKFAEENPEIAAQMLKSWMRGGEV